MLKLIKTKKFTKNLKKLRHKNKILDELEIAINLLRTEEKLPKKYKDHELLGKFKGIRDLHLGYDDILLYFIRNAENELILVDIGTHSHLFD